jgi:hypothetical protein
MPKKTLILMVGLMLVVVGCSKKDSGQGQTAPEVTVKPAKAKRAARIAQMVSMQRQLQPHNFSDSKVWTKGVNRRDGNQFFFNLGLQALLPIKPGYVLRFAGTGEAIVTQVGRQNSGSYSSVFVTVNRRLNPETDGFPNPVRLVRFDVQAAQYSKAGEWRNGIHLQTSGQLFFAIERGDQTPVAAGDKMRFARSGEATVTRVDRQPREDAFANVFVIVDKPLDPVADGYPNPITVLVAN